MSLDPHRASVVVDLLESATRAGALEKQEAAAILSSWIEEQKQVRSGASSPGPDSEPSHTPPPIQPILATVATAGTASTTMTIKTTTMTTTTSQAQTSSAELLGSLIVPASPAAAVCFKEAPASLTPKSVRQLSQKLPVGRHASVPNTPTAARQFSFLPQQSSPPLPPASTVTMTTGTTAAASAEQQKQRQSLQRHRNRRSVQPMRSLLHVFAACAMAESDDEDSGEMEPDRTASSHHRFCMDPPAVSQMPLLPPPPPQMSLPPPLQPSLLPRPESSGSDPQTYAVYDPNGAEQHTYCYIDDADLDASLRTSATESRKLAKDQHDDAASPSSTNDSGVYGSGLRVEQTTATETKQD